MTSLPIVIFGSSGHAKVLVDIIETDPSFELIGFIDNTLQIGTTLLGYPVLGSDDALPGLTKKYDFFSGIIGVGDNYKRSVLAKYIEKIMPGFEFVNCSHISANVSNHITMGVGNVIMPGVSVNASSFIGNHCILNTNCSLDHDCYLGDYASLGPNSSVGGGAIVEKFSHVGIGASVLHGASMQENSILGGGSMLVSSAKPNSVYVGVPARYVSPRRLGAAYL